MAEPARKGLLEAWFWVDDDQVPLVLRLAPTVAFASLLVWWVETASLHMTAWDRLGSPIVSALLMLSTVLMTRRPAWRTHAILGTMVVGSIFLLGKLAQHLYFPANEQLYGVMSVAIYGPIIYLSAFAIFKRGARRYCWCHYGVTVLILVATEIWPPGMQAQQLFQAKLMMVLIPPAYIIALSFMVRLRETVNAKERAAFEDKERMLAMMSHEIRGPLQTMLSSVDLLSTKVVDAASQRALARMSMVAQQLDRHLKDLMEFNRVNNPELAIEHATFDLEALVDQVSDNHQGAAQAKGLSLKVIQPERDVSDRERVRWQHARGDPARIMQVLSNLVSNAVKYTVEGHVTLIISTPEKRPDWVLIQVKDTGVGIETSDLQAIFEPFVRVIPPRMKPPEGSGLGLVIAKRLVQRLGGHLNVFSTPGQGSVFSLLLPLNTGARARSSA